LRFHETGALVPLARTIGSTEECPPCYLHARGCSRSQQQPLRRQQVSRSTNPS
jgi:hypothetical protein